MDRVYKEFEKAQESLRPLFDEIGTPQIERQSVIDRVVREVLQKFEEVVTETRGQRDSLQEQCEESLRVIHELQVQMGQPQKELAHIGKLALTDRVAQLKVERDRVERVRNDRLQQIQDQHAKLHALWKSLKTPHSPEEFTSESDSDLNTFDPNKQFAIIDETVLDDTVLRSYKDQIAHWSKVKHERQQLVARLQSQVDDLHQQLELNVADAADDDFSFDRIARLQKSVESLTAEKQANKSQIEALCHEVTKLWDALDTPAAERSRFPATCSLSAIAEVQATKERLIRLRQAKMGDLCLQASENLLALYAELNRDGQSTLNRLFPEIAQQNWSESLLSALQEVTVHAKEELESTRGLRNLAARRAELRKMKAWVEERRKDPNRFNDRKGGRLLKQETDKSNLVSKHLKPVEMQLIRDIEEWETEWQREFFYGSSDRRYVQCIIDDQQEDIEKKAAAKHGRQQRKQKDIENSMFLNRTTARTPTNMNKTVHRPTKVRVNRTPGRKTRKTPHHSRSAAVGKSKSRLPAPSQSQHGMPTPASSRRANHQKQHTQQHHRSTQPQRTQPRISQTPSNLPRSRHHVQVSRVTPMTAPARRQRPKHGHAPQTTPIRVRPGRYANVKSRIDTGRTTIAT